MEAGSGSGFTQRLLTNPNADIVEDRTVTASGSYSASARVNGGHWVMQMVAFRVAQGAADTTPPSAPSGLTASASGNQVNLSWTASNDNVGVTSYLVERCQGAGFDGRVVVEEPDEVATLGEAVANPDVVPARKA